MPKYLFPPPPDYVPTPMMYLAALISVLLSRPFSPPAPSWFGCNRTLWDRFNPTLLGD